MAVVAGEEQSARTNPRWVNLALAAVLIYYVVLVASDLLWGNFCGSLGVDYCSFWSAGYVANHAGYAKVYDLGQLEQVQRGLFPSTADPSAYATVPTPFLPVYILPFQLIALLNPFPGFILWSFLNLFGFAAYVLWWFRKVANRALPYSLLILLVLSLPVFLNLFWGQVNLWLMIFVGEYIRGLLEGKEFRAGLWLGGLLLKPQLLILIVPALLFRRSFKALFGFAINAGMTLLLSLSLAGFDGLRGLVGLWLGYVNGLPSNEPQTMMNWRMLALALNDLMPSLLSWMVAGLGIIITIVLFIRIWRVPAPVHSSGLPVICLGLFAATGALAWHSHFSTSLILTPFFLLAYFKDVFPGKLFSFWMFFPIAVRFAVVLVWVLIQASMLPANFAWPLNFAFGFSGLILNIAILVWSHQEIVGRPKQQFASEKV